jgi:hypothetical protein
MACALFLSLFLFSLNCVLLDHQYPIVAYTPLQTFVTTVIVIRSVDVKTFQEALIKLWPYYFSVQAAGATVLALTYPGSTLTHSGISGFLAPSSRWGTLVPIAATFVSSIANLFYALPATIKLQQERYGQGDFMLFYFNDLQVSGVWSPKLTLVPTQQASETARSGSRRRVPRKR